jgi:hypothetical protein
MLNPNIYKVLINSNGATAKTAVTFETLLEPFKSVDLVRTTP